MTHDELLEKVAGAIAEKNTPDNIPELWEPEARDAIRIVLLACENIALDEVQQCSVSKYKTSGEADAASAMALRIASRLHLLAPPPEA